MTLGNEIERRTSKSENFALPKGEGPDQSHPTPHVVSTLYVRATPTSDPLTLPTPEPELRKQGNVL